MSFPSAATWLAVVLAWSTFLAGGVYTWVWIPACSLLLALTFAVRPAVARAERFRILDVTLISLVAACLVQLAPMPIELLRTFDPNAIAVRTALWLPPLMTPPSRPWIPISIAPNDTLAAAGIFLSAVLMFWTCRHVCEEGGTGRIVRAVAFIGLIASVAAIVQGGQRIELYGVWRPLDAGARPYGPFVNRNHLATWIIMACPLAYGYLLARAPREQKSHLLSQRVVNALKHLGTVRIWLVVSVCVMALAVMLSGSRSGLTGLISAFVVSTLLIGRRGTLVVRRWVFFQFALLGLVAFWFANYSLLLRRLEETVTLAEDGRGRVAIWRDTIRLVEDFPITGTGAGTYGTAINVYQTAEPGYAIDEAHNHYLQLMAEGGAWLLLPAALAAGFFLVVIGRSLKHDRSANYLIRAGACAGMAGVLVQSIWETGLTMPANALLFAMLAAIATHGNPEALTKTC